MEQLRLVSEELQRKKLDAEKDRELFRDLYSKASAHASAVTKENNDLHERLALAEGQVKDGLRMVRGTYEARIALLEAEAEKWRHVAEVLAARDNRTDDEVRRRAALEPELQEENRRLREELEKLRMDYRKMEQALAQSAEQKQADAPPVTPQVGVANGPTVTSSSMAPS
ncbi:uncharacterized protein LAESUDRAFT_718280 [Laetiporus sulphureus 93-53]|uniref:Uncharacterized protein n=1 Tax=Laetiporus sulphureus 93-53 TaxID=1314785 RepID=A0A165B4F8_9APHY|nr:uncharacterized protein LAESUDRAFT_718280 [Laetiporus sulphureus 93-53]KZT00210.1 hypothetical protein LAESUDRAFT_718280 [Laetiporus sulphureus 93-53]